MIWSTDGLVVENVRLRNNLADGVNFARRTKNSIVRPSIRGMEMTDLPAGQVLRMEQNRQ